MIVGDLKRDVAILISTLPEALPIGVLFLAMILMDGAFAMFGIGLGLVHAIGAIIRFMGTPPTGYSLQQCSPWSTQATMRAVVASLADLQAGGSGSAIWISAPLSIVAFVCVYIMTAVQLLKKSFDTRVASYADATIPAATIACGATLLAYICFRYITHCDSGGTMLASVALGAGIAIAWAFISYLVNPDLLNIVHIPRSGGGTFDRNVVLCATATN